MTTITKVKIIRSGTNYLEGDINNFIKDKDVKSVQIVNPHIALVVYEITI